MNLENRRLDESLHAVSSSAQRSVPGNGATLECLATGARTSALAHEIVCEEDRLLRLKDIAAEARVSVKTVRRWIDLHGLPSQKLAGLRVVRKRDFLAFLEKERTRRN